jgi:hypothetical protein
VILISAIGSFVGLPENAGSDLTRKAISAGAADSDQSEEAAPRKPLAKT